MAQSEAQGETEHVFYIAGAAIVGVHAKGDYDLWLLDYSNDVAVQDWNNGSPVPVSTLDGRIRVNTAYTVERPGPGGEVDCIEDATMKLLEPEDNERLSSDVWFVSKTPATVAVSSRLWDSILEAKRPLPYRPLPSQDHQAYRLCVVARRAASGDVRYYVGFHVEVIAVAPHLVVRFFSWTDRPLGAEQIDLTGSKVDPPSRGHTKIGAQGPVQLGDSGALFVALDSFDKLPFLSGPKVPFGGGIGALQAAAVPAGMTAAGSSTPTMVREPPAVVVSADGDDWLDAVRTKITVPKKVMRDEPSALAALTSWFHEDPDRDEIELISHADDSHVLAVGTWRLTRTAFQDAPKALLERLRDRTMRIVGCATAHGAKANETLCYLRKELGLKAFGARGLIGTPDLTSTGTDLVQRSSDFVPPSCGRGRVAAEGYVVKASDLLRGGNPRELTLEDRELLFGGLSELHRKRIDEVGGTLLRRPYFTYPGLLQRPSAWTLLPSAGPDGACRIDSLFQGQLIRIVAAGASPMRREYLFLVSDPAERARFAAAFKFRYE